MSEKKEEVEQIDYLDSLMTLFIKSPQMPTQLQSKIKMLQRSRRHDKGSGENVAIPIKILTIDDNALDQYFEEE